MSNDATAQPDGEIRSVRGSAAAGGGSQGADPVTTEVIRHSIVAAVDEMKTVLCRLSTSAIIYDQLDFAAALFDKDRRLLGQSKGLPGFLGSLSFCLDSTVKNLGGESALREGDILFNNYTPDIGSHTNDAALMRPIFDEQELVGYAVVKAHLLDVGAKDPYCTDSTDIFQEGTIFPGVKLCDAGEPCMDVWRIALANTRAPTELETDLIAEIASVEAGAAALLRIIARYGREQYERSVELMLDHGEAVAREFFTSLPDGTYRATGLLDSDGQTDEAVEFDVEIEIRGSDLILDLTSAPPTRRGSMNCPLPMTVSGARMAVMALMGGADHVNDGYFRALEVRVRRDTLFWPQPPAPMFMFGWPANVMIDTFHRAIGTAAPARVGAGCGGDLGCLVWWGTRRDGSFWATFNNSPQGMGALSDRDGGAPLMHINTATVRPVSWEVFEIRAGVAPHWYQLIPDSGGAGKYRGGPGVYTRYEMVEPSFLTSVLERTKLAPWGFEGGEDGRNATRMRLIYPDGREESRPKATAVELPAGTLLDLWSGGGGGYGLAGERDPRAVHEDVIDGYVSESAARRDYPHAFTDEVITRLAAEGGDR